MEQQHKSRCLQLFPEQTRNTQFCILDIEDRYQFMDDRLIAELQDAVDPILEDFL